MSTFLTQKKACRICRGKDVSRVLSFGPTPLANAFLTKSELRGSESYFPLDVYLCRDCGLLQLLDVVAPEVLFKDYVYVSSTSPVFVEHFNRFAETMCKRFSFGSESLVIDIGSNDGILLSPFKQKGVRVLGIEPDRAIGSIARKAGVETISEFFSSELAKKVEKKYGKADLITATNVFAHIDDIHEVAKGVKLLLKKDGIFVVEAPYLVDFLEKNLFDTVYHEHLSYFSVTALNTFFERAGMRLIDVERVETHGGSLRVFATRKDSSLRATPAVKSFIQAERNMELGTEKTYATYGLRIQENRAKLISLLSGLKQAGKTIAGYGAPAKGNTLLNFFSIGSDLVSYIVDDSPHKQGKYTPGKRIPVVSRERLMTHPPDYLLIIAWNFAPSIMAKNEAFRRRGGKFIVPVPIPRIIK